MRENGTHSVLYTEGLSIGYPGKTIASGISIRLDRGELTAVIGINGSGKSTLLNTLTGYLPKLSGTVFLDDAPLDSFSTRSISEHISIVLPKSASAQHVSVEEVVSLGRYPYTNWLGILNSADKAEVRNALERIGIGHLAKRNCSELSDGQLQKVFIARALAQDTELIILDEPTNHLDLYHKAFVFKLLKKLTTETQKAVVFATHELNLALQLCDKIILIFHDKVVQKSPRELMENGYLKKLFPKDLIIFDPDSKSFVLTGGS